ncbi:MAG: AMMECR1 domain-containing protein [Myxococcota bacterium]|nr:AMMECR1 domain-containing protein [Myxococcota bacterium]
MRTCTRTLLSLLGLLLLALGPAACSSGDSSGGSDTSSAGVVGGQGQAEGFAVAPLPKEGSLDLNVRVTDAQGDTVKLKSLVPERALLVYIEPDTRGRSNKAAHRMLFPLLKSAAPVGFPSIAVMTEGSSRSEVDAWAERRKMTGMVTVIDSDGAFAATNNWKPRSAALVDGEGTVGAFFSPTEGWDERVGFEPVLSSDLLSLAWQLPDTGPELSPDQRSAAVELVRGTLRATAAGTEPSKASAAGFLGEAIQHPVYVSLFRPGTTTRLRGEVASGKLGAALAGATVAALGSAGDKRQEWAAAVQDIRFQIDLAGAPGPVVSTEKKALWYLVEPGVHGLIIRNGDREAVLLPAEPVTLGTLSPRVRSRDKKLTKIFRRLSKQVGATPDAWSKGELDVQRFRTTSFGVVTGDGPAVPMFRGNVLWEGEPSEADILESIRLGGLWLVNTVQEDGKFDYEYFPNRDQGSSGYNIVRHAGSVYGLFEMYELAGREPALAGEREQYIEAASRAISYVYDAMKAPRTDEIGDRVCLLDERGRCESGSAALALLTFLVRPPPEEIPAKYRSKIYRPEDAKIMEGLGLTLVDMIDSKGKIFRRYDEAKRLDFVEKEPPYYPGEAMLALVRFYQATKDKRWLDGSMKIAARQVKRYKRKRMRTPDHWVMQAFLPLWQITRDESYAEMAYAMANHYSSENYETVWTPWPDYQGAWRRVDDLPRTTRAGSRSEALRAVVNLAWERGDDAKAWENSLLAAARHLMEQQFSERNSYWLANPGKVRGAYPMGVVDNHCRIDNNQHALVGMVGALQVERKRATTVD